MIRCMCVQGLHFSLFFDVFFSMVFNRTALNFVPSTTILPHTCGWDIRSFLYIIHSDLFFKKFPIDLKKILRI